MKQILTIILCLFSLLCNSQDTAFIKVHFLYGSKPLKKYRNIEQKWFGGILGGHVGVEGDKDKIINFVPKGKFHWFAKKENKNSAFFLHSFENFYAILGGNSDSVKKAIVYIPITVKQKQKFDSIASAYLKQTPYDYALFGMRCGAATYDILAQINILINFKYSKTYKKIFYPKKLRKILFKKAKENGWTIIRNNGSDKRRWEKD